MKHLLLLAVLFLPLKTFAQTLEDDRLALIALYNATFGQQWYSTRDEPWPVPGLPGDNPCGWYGITCANGRVSQINLGGNDLSGIIPNEIENLTELTVLNLSERGSMLHGIPQPITGTIPPGLFKLTKLEFLDLSENKFDQNNTELIGNLTNLTSLAISPFWTIPNEIGNLLKLESLTITCRYKDYDYKPIGAIPATLGKLVNLKELLIYRVGVTGNIPKELGSLINLENLVISDNLELYGNIPGELGNLIKLKELTISGIKNAGNIPPELGNLINVRIMRLSSNQLQGSIPFEFNKLTELIRGFLDTNDLTGIVPNLSGMRNRALSVVGNKFTFAAIEPNESRFSSYYRQAEIPLINTAGVLSVEVGGTPSNNTYKWYRNSVLVATNIGDNSFKPTLPGNYKVEVTNSVAIYLTLISNEILNSLPVTLVYFTGKNEAQGSILNWKTTSETNNSGFDIEKSVDAKNFEKIGFVDGNGDSKENKTYNFTDQNPFSTTYYRLKQIDYDGKFEYSRIISVKNDLSGISIYPNPAGNQLFVKDLQKEENVTMRNSAGQIILHQTLLPKQPVNTIHISNGLYTITIGKETRKVMIRK